MFINKEFQLLEFNNIKNGQDLFFFMDSIIFPYLRYNFVCYSAIL